MAGEVSSRLYASWIQLHIPSCTPQSPSSRAFMPRACPGSGGTRHACCRWSRPLVSNLFRFVSRSPSCSFRPLPLPALGTIEDSAAADLGY